VIYVDGLMRNVASESKARRVGAQNGHRWCHLISDVGEAELLAFARKIGLKPQWIQRNRYGAHFDLTPGRRAAAVAVGAVELDRRRYVEILRANRGARFGRGGAMTPEQLIAALQRSAAKSLERLRSLDPAGDEALEENAKYEHALVRIKHLRQRVAATNGSESHG
jgi:hypothetical protein